MQNFNLEYQFQQYLKRVCLEESKMPKVQITETRRAFMGACGQMFVLLNQEVTKLEDETAIEVLEDMSAQVSAFWFNEMSSKN